MSYPECPHCHHEFDDEDIWFKNNGCEFPTEADGDQCEFDCPQCEQRLYVTLNLSPSWSFSDEDGDEIL